MSTRLPLPMSASFTLHRMNCMHQDSKCTFDHKENIEAVRCNGMNAGIVTMWFEIDDDDKKYLRLKRPVDAGQTPLMLKYPFDDLQRCHANCLTTIPICTSLLNIRKAVCYAKKMLRGIWSIFVSTASGENLHMNSQAGSC